MSVTICNCGSCLYRDDSIVLTSNPPKYNCLNRHSGKPYVEVNDYCKCWKIKTPDMGEMQTATTYEDKTINLIPEEKPLDEFLFTLFNKLQKTNIKLTERVSKLEDKVGKLEESAEVLDDRTESKEEPKQEKWIVHRTLRKNRREVYLTSNESKTAMIFHQFGMEEEWWSTYNKEDAGKLFFRTAVKFRDILNKTRQGKHYLWVISKVKE